MLLLPGLRPPLFEMKRAERGQIGHPLWHQHRHPVGNLGLPTGQTKLVT